MLYLTSWAIDEENFPVGTLKIADIMLETVKCQKYHSRIVRKLYLAEDFEGYLDA